MVDDLHTEALGLLLHVPADTTHPEDPENPALRIMAKWRRRLFAFPGPISNRQEPVIEPSQCSQNQEHGGIGAGIFHDMRAVGYLDSASVADGNVDAVVAGAHVADEAEGLWQRRDELFVEPARDFLAGWRSIADCYYAIKLAALAFLDEICSIGRRWVD